jgi:hypothetical protein
MPSHSDGLRASHHLPLNKPSPTERESLYQTEIIKAIPPSLRTGPQGKDPNPAPKKTFGSYVWSTTANRVDHQLFESGPQQAAKIK